MKIDGGCHCGAIRFTAEADPAKVALCHCSDCQSFSGAAWRASVPVLREHLVLEGEPKIYVKTADSGNKRLQGFCSACGSHIYATSPERAVFNIRLGAIRQRAELPPKMQGFCGSALPWASDITTVPHAPEKR
ncbi:MAG: GFA family protein [Proteobacteria bacterium]|nr:GFA family protein [Pseudomonadota bacterium]